MKKYYEKLAARKLKVNVKSLAAEAKFIRLEEKKLPSDPGDQDSWPNYESMRGSLQYHRKHVVRPEARAAQLAYACVRGVPYETVESSAKEEPDWERVRQKVKKIFCGMDERTKDWIASAKEHFQSQEQIA